MDLNQGTSQLIPSTVGLCPEGSMGKRLGSGLCAERDTCSGELGEISRLWERAEL